MKNEQIQEMRRLAGLDERHSPNTEKAVRAWVQKHRLDKPHHGVEPMTDSDINDIVAYIRGAKTNTVADLGQWLMMLDVGREAGNDVQGLSAIIAGATKDFGWRPRD